MSADASTFVAALSVIIPADGASKMDLLVTIVDDTGLAMPGVTVTFTSESKGVLFTQPAVPTAANGLASGSVSSTLEGVKIIRAMAETGTESVLLQKAASVRFYAPGPCTKNIISPVGVTNTYTGLTSSEPWGAASGRFYQQIHDDMIGVLGVLKAMSFRHKYDTTYAARSYDATLTVGDAAVKAADIQDEFAKNWLDGGSRSRAFAGRINFPAFAAQPTAPAPFGARIGFTQPVYHAGVEPLLWEVDISPLSAGSAGPDFEAGPGPATQQAGVVGKGCIATGQPGPLTSRGTTSYGSNDLWSFDETLLNGTASGVTVLAVGDTSDSSMGIPLPMRLTFIGSPSCFMNINLLKYITTTTRTSHHGDLTCTPPIPGVRFRTQWATDDNGICRTSNGLEHSYPYAPAEWPSRSLAAPASLPLPARGAVGQSGLVVQFCM